MQRISTLIFINLIGLFSLQNRIPKTGRNYLLSKRLLVLAHRREKGIFCTRWAKFKQFLNHENGIGYILNFWCKSRFWEFVCLKKNYPRKNQMIPAPGIAHVPFYNPILSFFITWSTCQETCQKHAPLCFSNNFSSPKFPIYEVF